MLCKISELEIYDDIGMYTEFPSVIKGNPPDKYGNPMSVEALIQNKRWPLLQGYITSVLILLIINVAIDFL